MRIISIKSSVFETSWGWIAYGLSDSGLLALTLPQVDRLSAEESLILQVGHADFSKDRTDSIQGQIGEYFKGVRNSFDIPLDMSLGTPFQQKVWNATARVSYGEQRSYAWVSQKIGSPQAMRAVGSALGSNPLAIIVPCHRIVRSDGELGGYGGGLALKRRLLRLESSGKGMGRLTLAD